MDKGKEVLTIQEVAQTNFIIIQNVDVILNIHVTDELTVKTDSEKILI